MVFKTSWQHLNRSGGSLKKKSQHLIHVFETVSDCLLRCDSNCHKKEMWEKKMEMWNRFKLWVSSHDWLVQRKDGDKRKKQNSGYGVVPFLLFIYGKAPNFWLKEKKVFQPDQAPIILLIRQMHAAAAVKNLK